MAQIEDYLDEIEELLESGRGSAFSGKTSVDADAIKTVIEDMRLDIPEEIKQAKILATERREIINRANQEADRIVEDAKSRSREYLTAAEMRVKELTEKASKSSEKELKDAHAGAQKILEEARAQADGLIARENIVKEAKTTAETLNAEAEKYLSDAKEGAAKLTADPGRGLHRSDQDGSCQQVGSRPQGQRQLLHHEPRQRDRVSCCQEPQRSPSAPGEHQPVQP